MFKKIIAVLLAAAAAVASVCFTAAAADTQIYDLNGDGKFDVQDVTYLQIAIANGTELDSSADFDRSGEINVNDVTYAQYLIFEQSNYKPDFNFQANSKSKLNLKSDYKSVEKNYPNSAYHPKVIDMGEKWNGYRFWLSYTPYPAANDKYENPHIVASNDLINFTDVKFNHGMPKNYKAGVRYNSDSELVYNSDKNRLELFWRYTDYEKNYMALYMRYSYDGDRWSAATKAYETNNREKDDMISPSIVYENGIYKVWYVSGYKLMYKEYKNDKWTKGKETAISYAVPTYTWHLDVEKINGRYELLACSTTNKSDRRHMSLYYSTSEDGLNWSEAEKVLEPSSDPTNWDGGGLYRPAFIYTNGYYIVLYSARNDNEDFGTGLVFGKTMDSLMGTDLDFINDSENSAKKLWKYLNK